MEEYLIWIGLAAVVIVFLVAIIGRYVTVSPDTALIVSGSFLGKGNNVFTDKENNKMKIVRGGGTFLWPIFQQGKRLSLMSSKLEVGASEVYTKQGVPISATGTVIIKIGSSVEEIATAAEQYLGKETNELEEEAQEVLEGHLRAILGSLTVEEIYRERDEFGAQVQQVASHDLEKMGLKIVSFTIKDVGDSNGYLESLGRPQIAEVKKNAEIAEAEAEKTTIIQKADAMKQAREAENRRAGEIALSEKDKQLKLAEYKKEQDVQQAIADKAYQLQDAELQKQLVEKQKEIELVDRRKQIEIETEEVFLAAKKLEAEVEKSADAKRYADVQKAEADKQRRILDAEAAARELELNAQAEAESIAKVGKAKAEAESLNISEVGRAKAEAAKKLAEAYKEYGQQAIMLELLKVYPEIVKYAAEPISNIDKITIIDGGEGNGVSQVSGYTAKTLAGIQESLKETLGLDMSELINSYVGNSNVGSKIADLNETLESNKFVTPISNVVETKTPVEQTTE